MQEKKKELNKRLPVFILQRVPFQSDKSSDVTACPSIRFLTGGGPLQYFTVKTQAISHQKNHQIPAHIVRHGKRLCYSMGL